jgi:serine/threonine protein phosphatase PrpC
MTAIVPAHPGVPVAVGPSRAIRLVPMKAVLWGKDHVDLGSVAAEEVGPRTAVAITRGRHRKMYQYIDPNEDAAVAVAGARGTLLAVADGHNGWPATEAAITSVVEALGDDPPPADLSDAALVELFLRASDAVVDVTGHRSSTAPHSRTTLVLALVSGRRLQWASFGDSAVYTVTPAAATALSRPTHRFVGYPMSRLAVDSLLDRGTVTLVNGAWVVLASDGFVDFARRFPTDLFGPTAAAAEVARGLVAAACDGGAGDNVAVAVTGQ